MDWVSKQRKDVKDMILATMQRWFADGDRAYNIIIGDAIDTFPELKAYGHQVIYSCMAELAHLGYVEVMTGFSIPDVPQGYEVIGSGAMDTHEMMYLLRLTNKGKAYLPRINLPTVQQT